MNEKGLNATPRTVDSANQPSSHLPSPSWAWQAVALLGFVFICLAAAAIGGSLTASSVGGWYQTLAKPALTPPDWVFGPVWTTLYLMMAVAAWLVWRRGGWRAQRGPLVLFFIHLAINVAWSGVFFGLQSPGGGFAVIVLLWLAIVATAAVFWRHSRAAALLLMPYLVWVSYASYLNFAIWQLNS
jgi:tryptophan-rich sensory protein